MKKLIIALVVVVASANFASAHGTKVVAKAASTFTVGATHCYFMKDGNMFICDGQVLSPMKEDATLSNGTIVTVKGVVKTRDGKVSQLATGQCCTVAGAIGDYAKMHAR